MGRLGGFLRILRPVNSVMMGVGILVGVAMAGGLRSSIPPEYLALAFVTGFTLTGSAMVINDYYDREIDAVNEPGRPIPSGDVKPNEAIAYSLILSAVGLAAAYLTSLQSLAIAVFSWLIMMAYSAWGKRTGFPGNLMVSTCIGLPFIYGGAIAGNISTSLLFSALAFLSNTGREVTKGIVDTEGDGARGVKTIAVAYGVDKAAYLASAFYVVAAAASVLPPLLNLVTPWYIPFVAVTDAGLVYGAVSLLRDHSRESSRRVKNQVLYWMLFGLLAFAAGTLL
ncbi:MAG: UbiA family prenyltransferase [Candidatus Bathyarchaeota archaeon]|nr:UbiA family prenyltransferase [Candidatus Bathyarchaeota archaeon]